MARLCFVVAMLIQIVYANEMNIGNCDECMRKGGIWCKERVSDHCSLTPPDDDWCPNDREQIPSMVPSSHSTQQPLKERRLYVNHPAQVEIPYNSPVEVKVNVAIINSTQNSHIDVSVYHTECDGSKCIATIEAAPSWDFCRSSGGVYEYAYAKVTIGNITDVTIKYHIACACACSQFVEKDSAKCNWRGSYACGVCTCPNGWSGEYCEIKMHTNGEGQIKGKPAKGMPSGSVKGDTQVTSSPNICIPEENSPICNYKGDNWCGNCRCIEGWTGEFCEKQICEGKRGDLQCTNPAKNDVECSGNGYCGPCDTCVCYNDREGSQYFDENDYCSDLCMASSTCESCLVNNTIGQCSECNLEMSMIAYNESYLKMKDSSNRRIWVKCNETVEGCYVQYWVKRNENNEITFMVENSCNTIIAASSTAGPKVPLILGILGIIAAVAAVGGVLAWKHFNTVPPLPLSDPEYQNIDAEDCTGENPLYKSPMSSFKNPTYGKW